MLIQRLIAAVSSIALVWTPFNLAWGEAMRDAGQEGQQDGQAIRAGIALPTFGPDAVLRMFPDSDQPLDVPMSKLFPEMHKGSVESLEALFGDHEGIYQKTVEVQGQLGGEASLPGEAYRTLSGSAHRAHPDLRNDPIWGTSDHTLGNLDLIAGTFTDCTVCTDIRKAQHAVHLPDYRTCEQVRDRSARGTLHHDYSARFIEFLEGDGGMIGCGEGYIDLFVGKVGDNYWTGHCTVYEQDIRIRVDDPGIITRAVLEQAIWDDYLQIYLNGIRVWNGPNNDFPPETPGPCELSTSWN